ncbi:DegT/DnrJ/EryC1/StrS family aminotransferase [Natrinema zhouii]|uniref:DegT/DnrJ/EryC1/StrS family aminotransferase n=1 Tax=Natrinema zhouii TaxID=1710539 RepID=A0A7D6CS41_9EURY|nr:DegT/DnrJ/EryC1/StrS family aminotransferase [Natrinema zhouii]QLK26670.1 DegT/DnrJ/EryC1/StrS family aminotransferase [Natrinema zhouii]
MEDSIPLFEIPWGQRDVANAVDSITRGSYWANGPYVEAFEAGLEEYLGVEHAVTVSSGTTALVAALAAHGVGEGDEVIVPSFTFIATANAVRQTGARPVFADIQRTAYGLDPDAVADAISDETAAIVPVHPYGAPCEIDALADLAADAEIPLIEDAAEAFGADYEGDLLGTFGDSTALSFCQNKILPTGEGGAVVTDDDEIAAQVERYRSHGRASDEYFQSTDSGEYVDIGTNVRMSDLVASIGCAQLEKVESNIAGRRRAAAKLSAKLADVPGVEPHTAVGRGRHVYQLYTVTLGPDIDRSVVIDTLTERDIASKVYWEPTVHQTQAYREGDGARSASLPVTEDVASRVLSLPIHPELSPDEIDRVVAGVSAGIERCRSTAPSLEARDVRSK